MIKIGKLDSILVFLGMLLFSGSLDGFLTTFDPNVGGSDSGGNINMQATSGLIYLLSFLLILARIEKFLKFSANNILFFIFLLIPIFSVFWSIAPETTFRRVIALLGTTFFSAYIAFSIPPDRLMRNLASVYALIAFASVIFIIALPTYGTHQIGEYAGVWRGVYAQKNEFGASMAIGLLALFLCPKYTKIEVLLSRLAIGLCLFLLLMSESRAAWLSFALALSIATPLHLISGHGMRSAVKSVTFLSILTLLSVGIFSQLDKILEIMGKDPTLTGRTGVWETTVNQALSKPILGYGYRAYWISDNKSRLQPNEHWSDDIGHAHNTYIDMFAELGMLGFLSFLLILSILFFKLGRALVVKRDYSNFWYVSCLTFIIIRGFAESTMLQHADINWVLFCYIFLMMNSGLKRECTKRAYPRLDQNSMLFRPAWRRP